ncbi:HEPN domain-containing protein [Nocardia brasiliensis]|uniref:ApeA N-terminal domain 1-containing protein n=1 Tax=Nocardia brasiliensis TaxID=37326 RepID=UPI002457A3BE|nr:HEPN domain-containing protein [Nocardia brasiliensis]
MKQCDSQRIRGWFYLPEVPDSKVPGILTWKPSEGAKLELIGGFSPEPEYRENPDGNGYVTDELVGDIASGTIYGESDSGQKLSIWEAQRCAFAADMSGLVREEFWDSTWVCVGAHVPSPQQSRFSSATLALDELYYLTEDGRFCPPQWVKIAGVESPGEQLDNGTLLMPYILPVIGGYRAESAVGETDVARYSVNTKATRPFVSPATQAMPDLRLDFMTNRRRSGPVIELRVDAAMCIRLAQDAAGSAADFVDSMAPVIDLLRLATFSPCGVETITLKTIDGRDIFLLSHLGDPAHPDEAHRPASTVFTFADVPLDSYLKTRQRLTQRRQASYAWNVVVGLCGYSSRYVEEFVSQSIAAAEGFHLWCLGGETNARLNDRLRGLHDRLAVELKTQIALDVENWIEWAVWARNHVAHGGTKRKRIIKDSMELVAIAESVHLVTYLVVLQELGVPLAKIRDALNNHPRLGVVVTKSLVVNQIDQQHSDP